jgi:hypothetical protein
MLLGRDAHRASTAGGVVLHPPSFEQAFEHFQ